MEITDVSVTLFKWPIETWYTGKMQFGGDIALGVVTVRTDTEIEGHAFLGSPSQGADVFAPSLIEKLKPRLIGRDPLDRGDLWNEMYSQKRTVSVRSIGAIDVALWDIAGKAAGLPVHRLIGTCKSEVTAYASSALLPGPEEYAEEASAFQEQGWRAYKIHPHGEPRSDVDICRKVRDVVGTDMVLMLDSMWSYGYGDALRVGRAIEELDFFWYEDPLAEEDLYNYVKLREKLDIPIMSTEYAPGGLYGMAQWVERRGTDILRGDVAVCGGITPLIRIAHLADAFRMKCEIHHGGNSLNNVANLHVTMGIPNCDFYEVFPADGTNKYALIDDIEVDRNGLVYAPTRDGLGYDIDWELVNANTTAML
ncbi:MAG: enolase C-terminal domain-like protein [Pseudomonadales bacterium]